MRSNKLQAIELLAHGSSIEDCSQVIGVTRRSIHNWLNDPEFSKVFDVRKHEIIQELNTRMIGLNKKALDVIEECLESESENIRLRSASLLHSRYFEALEASEIMEAIERINARIDQLALRR